MKDSVKKSFLLLVISVLLSGLLQLFFIQAGDEPDYQVQLTRLLNNYNLHFFNNLLYLRPEYGNVFDRLNLSIFDEFYSPNFKYNYFKIISFTIIFLFFMWIKDFFKDNYIGYSLLAWLSLPNSSYFLTLYSPESACLLLSILGVCFYSSDRKVYSLLVPIPMYWLDLGSFILYYLYISYLFNINIISKYVRPLVLFTTLVICVFLIAYFRLDLAELGSQSGVPKLEAVSMKVLLDISTDEHPLILRILYMIWTFVNLRPSASGSLVTLILVLMTFLMYFIYARKYSIRREKARSYWYILLLFPIIIISMAPAYAFAKYYVFVLYHALYYFIYGRPWAALTLSLVGISLLDSLMYGILIFL